MTTISVPALNKRALWIWRYVAARCADGLPPANREIGEALDKAEGYSRRSVDRVSTSVINHHLAVLETHGLIKRYPMTARGIKVLVQPPAERR